MALNKPTFIIRASEAVRKAGRRLESRVSAFFVSKTSHSATAQWLGEVQLEHVNVWRDVLQLCHGVMVEHLLK